MARGVGVVEGWPAVAWVAGAAGVLVVAAALLWLRSRWLHDRPPVPSTYRAVAREGSWSRSAARDTALVLVVVCVLLQLPYLGFYLELALWLLDRGAPPSIAGDVFFWIALVEVTCAGGGVASAWGRRSERPGAP